MYIFTIIIIIVKKVRYLQLLFEVMTKLTSTISCAFISHWPLVILVKFLHLFGRTLQSVPKLSDLLVRSFVLNRTVPNDFSCSFLCTLGTNHYLCIKHVVFIGTRAVCRYIINSSTIFPFSNNWNAFL